MKKVFSQIFLGHCWGGEGVSGPGSNREQAKLVGSSIAEILRSVDVGTVLDAGCGDWRWMQDVKLRCRKYIGLEIVPELAHINQALYGDEKHSFQQANLADDELPDADFVLCRDVLMHLPLVDALRTLRNLKSTGAEWLLTTTFLNTKNINVQAGEWHPINLRAAPFDFPSPLVIVPDWHPSRSWQKVKVLALWRFDEVLDGETC